MASKLKVQEVILQSPDGLQEATVSLSNDGVVSSSKQTTIPQEAWITPTFLNSWLNLGGANSTCQYMKDSLGFVHIKGSVYNGTVNSTIFTLPSGYRPSQNHTHIGIGWNGASTFYAKVIVSSDGNVSQSNSSSTTEFNLGNIVFKAEQ